LHYGSLPRLFEAACILLLLAAFFAYLLAPGVDGLRRRIRVGRRRRPVPRAGAILLVYLLLFVPAGLAWRRTAPAVEHWVHETAPEAIARIFVTENRLAAVDRVTGRLPLPHDIKPNATRATIAMVGYVEDNIRAALSDLVAAAEYVRWLAIVPIVSFALLAYAPAFSRSALRLLPRGHLQWRGDEYLRDVNSALAGYVRAQVAAGVVVGFVCAAAFSWFGVPFALSLGTLAGVLELIPVIGPLTVMVMAVGQADRNALAIAVFLIGYRGVQDYVVYPRLVRRGMHLSSVAVIFAVWCGAALDGAAGVVLAIPVAGFLSVSFRHWREYRDIERLVRTANRLPAAE
jgi:predicted PurR-regulated permease PerM